MMLLLVFLFTSILSLVIHAAEGFGTVKCHNIVTRDQNSVILSSSTGDSSSDQIDLLFDSECPICQMEVDFLMKRDINNRIRFTDLSSPDYNPAEHGNVKFEDGMRKIRAVLPDKRVVTGVEVFRQTYDAIGLRWIFAATKMPVIGQIAEFLYDIWAENRLRITGRGDMADMLKTRAKLLREKNTLDMMDGECKKCGQDGVDNIVLVGSDITDQNIDYSGTRVLTITSDNFMDLMESEKDLVIEFWAPW